MRWRSNLRLSCRSLLRSWIRTVLSVSGVAVGIASVVVLIGAAAGAERALRSALDRLGRNLLVVSPARTETSALRGASVIRDSLTVGDWQAIRQEAPGLLRTAPVVEEKLNLQAEARTVAARVLGTTADFQRARNFPLIAGRFIDEDDLLDRRRVAVIGPLVVKELFQGELPLGERVSIAGVPFRIIGVTGEKGVSADAANEDELVMVPMTTIMRRVLNVESLDRIYVQTVSEEVIPSTRSAMRTVLRRRHTGSAARSRVRDTPVVPDDFVIKDQAAIVRAQRQAGGFLSRLVPGLCFLALGLGGVGLLAVSLLSVRERYSEIGLRMAVGGRPRDILLQFLMEAVLLSTLGGASGLVVGAVAIQAGESLTRWPLMLSWQAVVYPLAISMVIAVVFGAYPALRAARLDPIVALNSN